MGYAMYGDQQGTGQQVPNERSLVKPVACHDCGRDNRPLFEYSTVSGKSSIWICGECEVKRLESGSLQHPYSDAL